MTRRRLIVLRHAKSSWNAGAASDHERPLNRRGRADAPRVAAELAARGWIPEIGVCSDSQRTRETWQRMSASFPDAEVRFSRGLYHASREAVSGVLCGLSDEIGCVMVVGHNPGWESVVEWLSEQVVTLTTCNAALLSTTATTWARAEQLAGIWTLDSVIRPREL